MFTEVELKELEQSFIQSIVFQPDCIYNVCDLVDPNDVESSEPKEIYTRIIERLAKNKENNIVDLLEEISEKSKRYIYNIQDSFVSSAGVENVAKKLKEYADAKNARRKLSVILNQKDSANEFMGKLEQITFDISKQKDGHSLVDLIDTGKMIVEKNRNIGNIEGYSWGIKKLDKATGGIIPGKTYVIGGSKKSGKTKFAINIIYHLIKNNVGVLFHSLEMNNISVVRWLVSRFSNFRISTNDYKFKDQLNSYLFEQIIDNIDMNNCLYIDTRPGLSFLQIKNQVWRQAQKNVKVVIIDYLQRMDIENKNENRATAIQKAVGHLADMAKQHDVALIILSQVANIAEGKMAKMGNLKESGGIAENVDGIFMLNNLDRIEGNVEKEKKKNQIYISVEQRDGESQLIKCKTKLEYNFFGELDETW